MYTPDVDGWMEDSIYIYMSLYHTPLHAYAVLNIST